MVVDSITDDPIRLREPRYVKRRAPKGEVRASSEPRIALVLNDDHVIHHVQERGYVEAPVRIRSIMAELDAVRSVREDTGQALLRPAYPRGA